VGWADGRFTSESGRETGADGYDRTSSVRSSAARLARRSQPDSALPIGLPAAIDRTAHESVGAALTTATKLGSTGHPVPASAVHDAASAALFHGFHAANYLAAGVAATGAVMALLLLPAHPTASNDDTADVRALGSPATAPAHS
jgi:hypothetical protein